MDRAFNGAIKLLEIRPKSSLTDGIMCKMADILWTTFTNAFYWMKVIAHWFKFHWGLFQGSNRQLVGIGSEYNPLPEPV